MAKLPLAIQLYSVRDLCEADFARTVRQVADIGYPAVEMAGYGNLKTATEARKALDDAGLTVAGAHVGIEKCEEDLPAAMDELNQLGTNVLIIPWMPEPRRENAAGWRAAGQSLAKIAQVANKRGIEVAYHNHSFEFDRFEGQTGMDLLFGAASFAVKAELDVYWIRHGGLDPVQLIQQFGARALALHLKDMARGEDRRFAPVGTGLLDFSAIIQAALNAGVKYGAVEQDDSYGKPPLEEIRISFDNLKRLGFA
jgi:sugar phosphate isomerase/epimerase